jgi:hypothetical protein
VGNITEEEKEMGMKNKERRMYAKEIQSRIGGGTDRKARETSLPVGIAFTSEYASNIFRRYIFEFFAAEI